MKIEWEVGGNLADGDITDDLGRHFKVTAGTTNIFRVNISK